AMLNIEGTKMSKSLGNYRTVVEMLDEHPLNGRAFRLLVLQTHYRKTMEVNAELMAAARAACQRLDALARRAQAAGSQGDAPGFNHAESGQPYDRALARSEPSSAIDAEPDEPTAPEPGLSPVDQVLERVDARGAERAAQRLRDHFQAAMDRDLGTPLALSRIFDTLRRANAALDEGSVRGPVLARKVIELAGVLGLQADTAPKTSRDLAIEDLVTRRQAARDAKDWTTADSLRDELSALGV
ncbi:MAG: hypothetical protein J4F50_11720, partial [Acidimicrobiia bacterium]|nr:hypothetical protein [Acidimicrobiia bacterium]